MTGVAGAAALLLSVGLLCARRIDTAVWLCALQALSAAVVLAETGTVAAILAFACNGVALPLALSRITSAPALTWRGNAILALSLAVVVPVAGILVFASAGAGGLVAVGASVAMLGRCGSVSAHTHWRRRSGCCRRRTAWSWWCPPSLG